MSHVHYTLNFRSADRGVCGRDNVRPLLNPNTKMQRVIQRTTSARKQAFKRSIKAQERQELLDRVQTKRARKDFGAALSSQFKEARKNRWEDWEKGPLAPMRDAGLDRTTYGGLEGSILHPPRLPKHEQRRHVLFAAGDRVCVIRGQDQGKINVITQVNRDSETVLIKDVNMVCTRITFPPRRFPRRKATH